MFLPQEIYGDHQASTLFSNGLPDGRRLNVFDFNPTYTILVVL